MIDWSINAGTLCGFLIGGGCFVWAVRRDVSVLAARLEPMEDAIKRLITLLEQVGRQDERLKAVERDVERNDPRKQWRQPSTG